MKDTRVRGLGLLCAGAALIGTLGACGDSSDEGSSGSTTTTAKAAKTVRVAHFLPNVANTYNQANKKGSDTEAAKLGNVKVQTFSSDFDPNKQVQQIQTATATGQYDAFIVNALDGVRVVPAIRAATAKGIKVVCEFSICGPDQAKFAKQIPALAAQTGINAGKLGDQAAPVVNAACKGKDPCNLAIMFGLQQLVSEKWWADHLKAGLDPNVKVVATGEGAFLADPSYKAFKDILQAHPNIDAVVAPGDQMIVGSEQAIKEAGLKGKIALIGTGASDSALKAITDGRWYGSAILRPYHDGQVAMEAAVHAARGEKVEPLTDTLATPLVPGGVVTRDNAADWKPEWAG
jgi:ribose transport system substrate-binding protein